MSIEISIISLKNKMVAQTHKSRVIANNLANVNTTGFKKDEMFFNVLEQTTQMKVETDFSQGAMIATGNPLDFALSGRGFFVVETEKGEAYTRNGHFMTGSDGILRTSDGDPVLGDGGLINISLDGEKSGKITVSAKGEIYIDNELIDTLKIMDFDNLSGLNKLGKDLLVDGGNALGGVVDNPMVFQGKLEESNVNPANELINLIELQRQYESSQKSMKAIDDALKKAATEVSQYR
ncbi:MAG TPA: flagellar hook-basal body protein [Candidatus Marinimicrobia bacterium]|nr:flagellar hook-basal body protein [Candidatus Neomarinimicrobiota bacterium]